ncbi:MAG: prephenate dehydrogenase, partial [Armatimonadetes bacterium]|nr:prephenate dehydrogenase [Armatimonadota bacterium]
TYFLTATSLGGDEAAELMSEIVRAIGGKPVMIDAEAHDRLVAVTSHLPHAAAAAVMLAVAELVPDEQLRTQGSGGGLRDTTRIAAGSPELWRDIFLANADALADACITAGRWLQELARAAQQGDGDRLAELLEQARRQRQSLDPDREEGGQ